MAQAMAHWGADGGGIWTGMTGALGHRLRHNTPEARYEQLPIWDASRGLAFTAAARLDNRAELCDQLQIPHPERAQLPDGELLYRSYCRWDTDCPDKLLGDWSLAAWQPQARRLFLARDHQGITALNYWQRGTRLAFASEPAALYALGAPRRLNEDYLAQLIVSWMGYRGPETIFQDIYRLPPAHALLATPARTQVWRYWHLEATPELRLPSFDDYVEGFLEVYDRAVRARLRTVQPIGTTLSGGLDSGSVTALAARALAEQDQGLTAFTAVPLYSTANIDTPRRLGNETELAAATARQYANVQHVLVDAAQITPLAGIRRTLQAHHMPSHAASNYFWLVALFEAARAHGVGTLLMGQGGNGTVSWNGAPEYSSLRASIQREGWRQAVRRRLPLWVQRILIARRLRRHGLGHTAIHPDFAARLDLIDQRIAGIGHDKTHRENWHTPRELRHAIVLPGAELTGDLWAYHSAAFGLDMRDPTNDKRVMAYTFGIPDAVFVDAVGMDRAIIRAAMHGMLPDAVRLNRKHGLQAADIIQRLRASALEVDAALAEIDRAPINQYLDMDNLRQVWRRVQHELDPATGHAAGAILLRGLMAGLFLAHPLGATPADDSTG